MSHWPGTHFQLYAGAASRTRAKAAMMSLWETPACSVLARNTAQKAPSPGALALLADGVRVGEMELELVEVPQAVGLGVLHWHDEALQVARVVRQIKFNWRFLRCIPSQVCFELLTRTRICCRVERYGGGESDLSSDPMGATREFRPTCLPGVFPEWELSLIGLAAAQTRPGLLFDTTSSSDTLKNPVAASSDH
jgi:hypothetical protein